MPLLSIIIGYVHDGQTHRCMNWWTMATLIAPRSLWWRVHNNIFLGINITPYYVMMFVIIPTDCYQSPLLRSVHNIVHMP